MNSGRRIKLLVALLFIFALWAAYFLTEPWREPRWRKIWCKHEAIIEHVVYGDGHYDLQDFFESALFFSELTGIEARIEGNFLGTFPTEHTKHDLILWKHWYKENRSRLYVDSDGKVKVRPK